MTKWKCYYCHRKLDDENDPDEAFEEAIRDHSVCKGMHIWERQR